MSACDPIDLSVIKQEVLLDFFDFHLKNEEVWAILNENSVFLASNLFKLTGIEQFLYNIFSGEADERQRKKKSEYSF